MKAEQIIILQNHTQNSPKQYMVARSWLLTETLQCVCCAWMLTGDKLRGKLPCLWFPLWNVLLCWMSGCLLWLIMLAFTRLSQCPITTQRWVCMVIWRARWSVTSKDYHWCFALLSLSSSSYATLCIIKVCICSFPSSLPVYPADRHMFIQGPPAEIRHAERCVKNPP